MAREIYAYECRNCGQAHYPFRMRCKNCGQNGFFEFDAVPLPRNGRLLTFTKVHNLAGDFDVATLTLGIVELENGLRCTGQLQMDQPQIGMSVIGSVEIVRRSTYEKFYGMVFRAA